MIPKPESCRSCPLYGSGVGFGPPWLGNGPSGVGVVGEALGEHEAAQGQPFVGPAGAQLDHILRRAGLSRDTFAFIDNVIHCRPPGNQLAGKPYESAAVRQCRWWLDDTIRHAQPKALLALGATALRELTGLVGPITRNRGFVFEGRHGVPVVGTFHPSYLLPRRKERSSAKYTWVVIMDIRKAIRAAAGQLDQLPQTYLLDPSLDQARAFLGEYDRTPADTYLAWDLETAYSLRTARNESARTVEDRQTITRISFAFRPGYAMTLPPDEPYLSEIIRPLLRQNRPKVGWNCPAPHHRVLTEDLYWVPAGDLRVGDRLAAFDTAVVTHTGRATQEVYTVELSDGTTMTVTPEHPWWMQNRWRRTYTLKPGQVMERLVGEPATVTVRAVRPAGIQEIVQLSTSTETYILEGFGAHNSHGFDEPIVRLQEGWELGGTLYDGMDAWHVLQPNLERNLEFVASLMTDHLKPWKHLSQSDPAWYSAQDADATLTAFLRILSALAS